MSRYLMQNNFDEILTNLENRLQKLFSKFLSPHLQKKVNIGQGLQSNIEYIDITKDSQLYQIDIEAYSVLSHAAFEHYFEEIATETAKKSIKLWEEKSQINDTLLLLVSYMLSVTDEEEHNEMGKVTQNAPNRLDLRVDSKGDKRPLTEITKVIYHVKMLINGDNEKKIKGANYYFQEKISKNHGIGLEYLMKILIPVALDVAHNPDFKESLNKLRNYRGSAAHKMGIVKDIPTPLAIFQNEKHILKFCQDLCQQAKAKF